MGGSPRAGDRLPRADPLLGRRLGTRLRARPSRPDGHSRAARLRPAAPQHHPRAFEFRHRRRHGAHRASPRRNRPLPAREPEFLERGVPASRRPGQRPDRAAAVPGSRRARPPGLHSGRCGPRRGRCSARRNRASCARSAPLRPGRHHPRETDRAGAQIVWIDSTTSRARVTLPCQCRSNSPIMRLSASDAITRFTSARSANS